MDGRDPYAGRPFATARGAREAAAAAPAVDVAFPPEVYAPAGAQDFTPTDSGTVPAAVGAVPGELVLPLCVAQVGDDRRGVVRAVTIQAADTTKVTQLKFFLRINGTNVPGFGPARLHPVIAGVNLRSYAPLIRVPPGATVAVVVQNPETTRTYDVSASFEGWSWPVAGGAP